MPKITLEDLVNRGACHNYRVKFRDLFGEEVEVTVELCVKYAQDFDWNWARDNLLGWGKPRDDFDALEGPAYQEMTDVTDPAYKEYSEAREKFYAELLGTDRSEAPWRTYRDKCQEPLAKYNEVCKKASVEYNKKCAEAFGKVFLAQHSAVENT